MLKPIAVARSWHVLVRTGMATISVVAATALQLPIEIAVPGEPFLLNFIVVAISSILFGRTAGFLAVAETTVVSPLYFEPVYSFGVVHAADLLAIEAYAVLAAASVEAFCHLMDDALSERSEAISARSDANLAHSEQQEAQERVSDVEAMNRRLAESEQLLRATFENAAVGISHFSPDGKWLRVNDAMCRILGWSADELVGKSFQELTHQDDLAVELDNIEQLCAGKIGSYRVDKRTARKDGTTIWIRRSVSCVRPYDGSVNYFVSVVEDISEQKRAEEDIKLMMREANHRVKNMLSLAQAIARQTAASSPAEFTERFTERLQALAANQVLLVNNKMRGVDVEDLLHVQLAPFGSLIGTRVTVSGLRLRLNAVAAQAVGLALHELARPSKTGARLTRLSLGKDGNRPPSAVYLRKQKDQRAKFTASCGRQHLRVLGAKPPVPSAADARRAFPPASLQDQRTRTGPMSVARQSG